MPSHVPPFAVSDAELREVEGFCSRNGLDQIGRICAELRVLRAEYLAQSNRIGKQRAMIETLEHDPTIRYSKELEVMVEAKKEEPNAPAVT
jgi:hypothetical protein